MSRRRIVVGLLLAAIAAIAGASWYRWQAPGVDIVSLELAGSAARAQLVVGEDAALFDQEIRADWVFIAGYLGALLILAGIVSRACPWRWLRRAAWPLGVAAVLAAVLDVVENLLLLQGLAQLPAGDTAFAVARLAAIGKFTLVAVAAVALVVGALAALGRPADATVAATGPSRPSGRAPDA